MPKLTWIGHSAFLLEDDAGNVVAVDPFIEDNPVTSVDPKSLKPSTILLTHAHNDHVGDTIDMAEWNDAKVICTVELGNWLESQGVRDVVQRQPWWDHRLHRGHRQVHPGLAQLVVLGWPESGGQRHPRRLDRPLRRTRLLLRR